MKEQNLLTNTCNMSDVRPIMMALPYPATQVREKNQNIANLLSIDYCGGVSEMSAIAQYINHENRLSCERCPAAKTMLGIAMAEMIHLQRLAELIFLLGGNIDFIARYRDGQQRMWSPKDLKCSENAREMIISNIESENAAINQYRMHIKMISDANVNAVLARIIRDEEYHIVILKALLEEISA